MRSGGRGPGCPPLDVIWDRLQRLRRLSVHVHVLTRTQSSCYTSVSIQPTLNFN